MPSENEFTHRPALIAQAEKVKTLQVLLQIVAALGVVVILIYVILGYQIGAQQRDRLLDCTTPAGECYKEGQKRTAEAIKVLIAEDKKGHAQVQEVLTIVAVCADRPGPQTREEIMQCMIEEVKEGR